MPAIKYNPGIRLPPDRYCIHSANYAVKSQRPQTQLTKTAPSSFAASTSSKPIMPTTAGQYDTTVKAQTENLTYTPISIKRRRDDEDDYDA